MERSTEDTVRFGGYVGNDLAQLVDEDGELMAIVPCPCSEDGLREHNLVNIVRYAHYAVNLLWTMAIYGRHGTTCDCCSEEMRACISEATSLFDRIHSEAPSLAPLVDQIVPVHSLQPETSALPPTAPSGH